MLDIFSVYNFLNLFQLFFWDPLRWLARSELQDERQEGLCRKTKAKQIM
jgi:hypothetical protein